MIDNKSISERNFTFIINLYSAYCFLKILKESRQFCCSGLLHSSKLRRQKIDLFDAKFSADFNVPKLFL